jgi:4-amino-4-deoxy-L-arabinose transferase-like glycosyltransferase
VRAGPLLGIDLRHHRRSAIPRLVSARRPSPGTALLLVLLVAALLRVASALTLGDVTALHGDEGYYVRAARSLAAGAGYPGALRPPGYPAFLAGAFALTGDSLRAARLAQVAVALAGIAALFALVRRRFGTGAATLSALLCALHPTLVFYGHVFWSETLVATLLLVALDLLDRFASGGGETWLVAAGLVLGAAVLTRDMLLFFVPVVALWVAWADRGAALRAVVRRAALVVVPVALVLLPWMARNHALTGRLFVLSTNSWFPIAVGNLIPRDRVLGMGEENRAFNREFAALAGDELAQNALARAAALRAIAERQPGWIVRKLVRNTYYLFSTASQTRRFVKEDWVAPGWRGFTRRLSAVEAAFYVLQMVLGLVALWLVPGGRIKVLVVALLLFHWGVYVVANATNRFRVPLLPLFVLYVGPLLTGAVVPRPRPRWRVAGAAACLAAFLAIVATPYLRRAGDAASEDPGGDARRHGGAAVAAGPATGASAAARAAGAGAARTTQLVLGPSPGRKPSQDLVVIEKSPPSPARAPRAARPG